MIHYAELDHQSKDSLDGMSQTEVFTEAQWDDAYTARQMRDQRLAQLQAQGYVCTVQNLQTVLDGRWVYLVTATASETTHQTSVETQSAPSPRPRPQRKALRPAYETR